MPKLRLQMFCFVCAKPKDVQFIIIIIYYCLQLILPFEKLELANVQDLFHW